MHRTRNRLTSRKHARRHDPSRADYAATPRTTGPGGRRDAHIYA